MKRAGKVWVMVLLFWLQAFGVQAQQSKTEVGQCLQSGNASCLSARMGNTITLSLGGDRGTYSKAQAEMVLRDFFRKHTARGFKVSPSSDSHVSGTLNTDKGDYHVFISIITSKGGYAVQEIRLEQ